MAQLQQQKLQREAQLKAQVQSQPVAPIAAPQQAVPNGGGHAHVANGVAHHGGHVPNGVPRGGHIPNGVEMNGSANQNQNRNRNRNEARATTIATPRGRRPPLVGSKQNNSNSLDNIQQQQRRAQAKPQSQQRMSSLLDRKPPVKRNNRTSRASNTQQLPQKPRGSNAWHDRMKKKHDERVRLEAQGMMIYINIWCILLFVFFCFLVSCCARISNHFF